MAISVIMELVTPGNTPGTYGIGCTPEFDQETRMLAISPGVFRIQQDRDVGNDLEDEFVFPGGEVVLPPEAMHVWVGWRWSDRQPTIIVDVGQGIDSFNYRPAHRVYMLGTAMDEATEELYPAHILSVWRCHKRDRQRWKNTRFGSPPDPKQFAGEPAEVLIQTEIPAHVKASMDRREVAEGARQALSVLMRIPSDQWTDQQLRQVLINLVKANLDVDLPLEIVGE